MMILDSDLVALGSSQDGLGRPKSYAQLDRGENGNPHGPSGGGSGRKEVPQLTERDRSNAPILSNRSRDITHPQQSKITIYLCIYIYIYDYTYLW